MKLLIDMNLSPRWVDKLAEGGHEASHWSSIGNPSAPDSEILAFARSKGLIVFTHDLDFGTLLAYTGQSGPSVVQLREQNVDPSVIGEAVLTGLAQCQEVLLQGALVTIDLSRSKARVLPLSRANL